MVSLWLPAQYPTRSNSATILKNGCRTFVLNLSRSIDTKFEDCGLKNNRLVLILEGSINSNCWFMATTS